MSGLRRLIRWVCTWRVSYWIFRRQPGITLSLARPTTSDGETVQLTTTMPVGATSMEIAGRLETLSIAVQARMIRQNEILLRGNLEVGHLRWKRLAKKLQDGGKFDIPERRWWQTHHADFTEEGPTAKLTDEKARAAAQDQESG